MAERPCKASDTSSDDHPASILYPVRQSPDRHPATPLPLTAPHKKGSLAQKREPRTKKGNLRTQKKGISAHKKRESPHTKKGSLRIESGGSLLFAAPGAEASGRMDQFLKVRPLSSASIEIGFERSTSPARIRFERSLTT